MKKLLLFLLIGVVLISCNTKQDSTATGASTAAADTLTYPYKATYSSDITSPSHPEIAQKVLTVWKLFADNKIDGMKAYYADTVTYDNAEGNRYHGSIDTLLSYVRNEMKGLDSLRFDISRWESVHMNDKDEDWVSIWAMERHYPKQGKPDSILMQENWKVKDGKVVYFNQYKANVLR